MLILQCLNSYSSDLGWLTQDAKTLKPEAEIVKYGQLIINSETRFSDLIVIQ